MILRSACIAAAAIAAWLAYWLDVWAMLAQAWPVSLALATWLLWWHTGRSPFWWLARGLLALDAAWEGTVDCACLTRLWWRRVRENWRRLNA